MNSPSLQLGGFLLIESCDTHSIVSLLLAFLTKKYEHLISFESSLNDISSLLFYLLNYDFLVMCNHFLILC